MKYLIASLLILTQVGLSAQIKGNQKVVTRTFDIKKVTDIEMNLYAEVIIDCAAEEKMVITAEENIMDLIEKSVEDGRMKITQKDWIQPNYRIKINIGAPNLERIQLSVHESTVVKNIDRSTFRPMAIIGKLILEGKVESLYAAAEIGEVDARKLDAKMVNINIWRHGKILLASPVLIEGKIKEDGLVNYMGDAARVQVSTSDGGRIQTYAEMERIKADAPRYIEFKLKNNSANRIQCEVVGPKPDGSRFGYGFPMNPGQVRKKNWTVGSKVYKKTTLGARKLLAEVVEGDEGKIKLLYNKH